MKNEVEIVGARNRWEAEVLALTKRFDERLSENMKAAILIAMLPKELQDNLYERGQITESLTYEAVREHAIRISNNKQQLQQPTKAKAATHTPPAQITQTTGQPSSRSIPRGAGICSHRTSA